MTKHDLYKEHLRVVSDRFDRALESAGYDGVVIFSGSQHMIFLDDMPYPFKSNPHFKTWVPLTGEPDSYVVYEPGSKPRVLFHQPVDFWHKPPSTPAADWVTEVDLEVTKTTEEAAGKLPKDGKWAWLGEPANGTSKRFDVNPEDLISFLDYERAWKTEYEIDCMRRANDRAARGHIAARRAFEDGASEWEIHLEYLRATEQNEAGLPYGNIIALNENAAVLHYQHQERERPGDNRRSFLIDAGASWNGYASDITRTWSAGDAEFQFLIDSMNQAQKSLVGEVRPGVDYKELHMSAHRRVGQILRDHELVDMSIEEMVDEGVTGKFFPHGVGHYIGLQVHDVGGFKANRNGKEIPKPEGHPFLRLTRVLEPTHVLTIEPGLYFIDSLLDELRVGPHGKGVDWRGIDRLRPFGGVRIEDDVVVRERECENLTRDAFARIA
ncbi:MAG: Xaa-Pro dipeptidase [Acidobacteria bacterium]|nr:Xaa-Pro dipeptidase [Acidobacteriota bacterium]